MAGVLTVHAGCVKDIPYFTDEPQEEQSEQGGGQAVTVKLSDCTKITTSVREISGMCFNRDSSGFYVVSDENGLYEINLSGSIVREIWTSSVWGKKEDHDLEAVAFDSAGGKLYVLDEAESRIYVLSGKDWSSRTAFMDIDLGATNADNGPEGMAYGAGKLYVTNQGSPTRLATIDVATKKIVAQKDITFMKKYLSDLTFDSKDSTLWIIDSTASGFFHCKTDGTLLGKYELGFSVEQGEAIAIDRKRSCVWIGSDEKPSSPIYKIPLTL